ncbi:hypothetical protein GCM10010994_10430 [Chelatococcus reniformis]|uniref:HTH araC/xylS-type domain-containing protein n=1 Tax=Chelatococcus reniformis TaxID=1494448 RepID=A0A916TZN7_9HYPH|nr:hypothetical protein GCM10010994_10430 [Chelatococcus reniformis]
MLDELLLTTDGVEPRLRNEVWRAITQPVFETTLHPDGRDTVLRGSVRSRPLGSLLIGRTSFNAQRYRRDRRVIAQGGLDHYLVQLLVAGSLHGDCDGRPVAAAPGDIFVLDLARPLLTHVSSGSRMTVVLPRQQVDKAAGGRSLHGLVLDARSPMTQVLADFIVSLSSMAAELDREDALAIEEAAIELIASGLARHAPPGLAADPALLPVLRRHVLAFVDAHLADPGLGPAELMRRFRISRAHLYRMFAAEGGVARLVRERRLDAACRELLRGRRRPITDIALSLGFSSSSQLLRAFRARFAMTPSEARREGMALALAGQPLVDLQEHFAAYAQRLRDR